jgi:hypothetical protein
MFIRSDFTLTLILYFPFSASSWFHSRHVLVCSPLRYFLLWTGLRPEPLLSFLSSLPSSQFVHASSKGSTWLLAHFILWTLMFKWFSSPYGPSGAGHFREAGITSADVEGGKCSAHRVCYKQIHRKGRIVVVLGNFIHSVLSIATKFKTLKKDLLKCVVKIWTSMPFYSMQSCARDSS